MDKNKVKQRLSKVEENILAYEKTEKKIYLTAACIKLHDVQEEVDKSDWISVDDELPVVDKEAVVLTTDGKICFGHIVDKKIAKDYNGWNIPGVEYWLPFVDPKGE